MKYTLTILSMLLAVLGVLSTVELVPFIPADMGILVIALAGTLYGVVRVLGDYLDNKLLDDSFKPNEAVKKGFQFVIDFFKPKS